MTASGHNYGHPNSHNGYRDIGDNIENRYRLGTSVEFGEINPTDSHIPIEVSLTALRMQKEALEKEVRRLADEQERGALLKKINDLTFQKKKLESALNQARQARAAIAGLFDITRFNPKKQDSGVEPSRSTPPPDRGTPPPENHSVDIGGKLPRKPVYIRKNPPFNYRRRCKWLLMGMMYKMTRMKRSFCRGNGNGSLFSGKRGISLCGLLMLSLMLVYTQIRLIKHVETPGRSTLPGDRCHLRFGQVRSLPPVALASFPGSGNTWLRHLIEQSTGYYTGNVKRSPVLESAGFKGEDEDWRAGTTIVQKTHEFSRDLVRRFHASILLIRNPYKAMLAEASREYAGKTGFAPMDIYYNEKGWDLYVKKYSSEWESQISQWLLFHEGPLLLVRFEDVKDNPLYELRRINNFLNVTFADHRVACVIKNMEGQFHRPEDEKKFLGFDPFTQEMHINIEERIERVNDLLDVKGFKHVARVYPN